MRCSKERRYYKDTHSKVGGLIMGTKGRKNVKKPKKAQEKKQAQKK